MKRAYDELIGACELGDDHDVLTLDLHEDHLQLDPTRHIAQALKDARKMERRVIKVIHGRGRGILQAQVQRWLEAAMRKGDIAYFRASDRLSELGAVIYVVVEPRS